MNEQALMKTILKTAVSFLVMLSGQAIAGDASMPASTGTASFMTENRTYMGTYSTASRAIAVDIDGLTYKGAYASNADDSAKPSSGAMAAPWGRAFLFASSAKTLQCKLYAGFPNANGQCLDAEGRRYQMKAGTFQTPKPAP